MASSQDRWWVWVRFDALGFCAGNERTVAALGDSVQSAPKGFGVPLLGVSFLAGGDIGTVFQAREPHVDCAQAEFSTGVFNDIESIHFPAVVGENFQDQRFLRR